MARDDIHSEHVGMSRFTLEPGVRAPYGHHHSVQEEVYVITSGSGRFKLDDEIVDVAQWDVIRVAPAVVRAMEAGPDGMEFVVAGSDRPEGGDGEIVAGWWSD
jgi:mannose-6-phosphate isomerase-like protein (cupin superfamily)